VCKNHTINFIKLKNKLSALLIIFEFLISGQKIWGFRDEFISFFCIFKKLKGIKRENKIIRLIIFYHKYKNI